MDSGNRQLAYHPQLGTVPPRPRRIARRRIVCMTVGFIGGMGLSICAAPLAVAADDQAAAPQAKEVDKKAAEDKPAPPKPRSVSWVIRDIRQEALDAVHKTGQWPRDEANYAAEKNYSVPNADIVRVVQRRLHPDPAIDGYVRWQLLSFQPSFELAKADTAAYRRAIAMLPRFMSAPEPDFRKPSKGGVGLTVGTQSVFLADRIPVPGVKGRFGKYAYQPVLGVATSGVSLGSGGQAQTITPQQQRAMLRDAANRLADARARVHYASLPALAFRDQFIPSLPEKDGVRFVAMLQDVADRITTGHLSTPAATDRLLDASFDLHKQAIPRGAYGNIGNAVDQLRRASRRVTLQIIEANWKFSVRQTTLEIPEWQWKVIAENVALASRGLPPKQERPKRDDVKGDDAAR